MAITGVIAEITRSKIPEAWNICLGHPGYGEAGIKRNIELTKYLLFNTVVDPSLEDTTYNPLVQEYAGILAALRMIASAAEIVNNSSFQRTMFGDKNQQETYLNRYENLMEHRKFLKAQADELLPFVEGELEPTNTLATKGSPILYTEVLEGALTEDPNMFDWTFDQRNNANPVERDDL